MCVMNHFFLVSTLSAIFFLPIENKSEAQLTPLKQNSLLATTAAAKNSSLMATGWEPVRSWHKTTNADKLTLIYERSLPEVSKEVVDQGAVLVFAKGYNFSAMKMKEKPMRLPFVYFSPVENEAGAYQWIPEAQTGKVVLTLSLPTQQEANFSNFKDQVLVRYFVVRPEFLKQHNLTLAQLKALGYKEFIALAGEAE